MWHFLQTPTFSSSVLRWSPNISSQIEDTGHMDCNVLVIAIDYVATGKIIYIFYSKSLTSHQQTTFYLMLYLLASAFMQTHFLHMDHEKIGVICSGLSDNSAGTLEQEAFTDETCYIYRLKNEPSVLFCLCKTSVHPEQAYSWVDQVKKCPKYFTYYNSYHEWNNSMNDHRSMRVAWKVLELSTPDKSLLVFGPNLLTGGQLEYYTVCIWL